MCSQDGYYHTLLDLCWKLNPYNLYAKPWKGNISIVWSVQNVKECQKFHNFLFVMTKSKELITNNKK
jgi:hypothetical protein